METCHSDAVQIALAADAGYFDGMLVTAVSIARFADQNADVRFTILDGGIADADFDFLCKKISMAHAKSSFRRERVDESRFADFGSWTNNKMTYARLLLPEILSDCEYVIYCDVDFLWLDDVVKLWRMRDPEYAFVSTKDGCDEVSAIERKWFERHGIKYSLDEYVCAGLVLFNLSYFRRENLVSRLMEFLRDHPDVPFLDQTALNVVLSGKIKQVSQHWQRFTRDLTQKELDGGPVLHFTSESPWKGPPFCVTLSDTKIAWYKILARIKGVSVISCIMKDHHDWRHVIVRRLVFLFSVWPLTRSLFFTFLRMMNKAFLIDVCSRTNHRFNFGKWIARF